MWYICVSTGKRMTKRIPEKDPRESLLLAQFRSHPFVFGGTMSMMVPLPLWRSRSAPARRNHHACYMLDREDTEDLFPLWRTTDAHQDLPIYGDICFCSALGCSFRPLWRPHFVTTCSWRTGLWCPVCGCVSIWPLTFPYDRRPPAPPAFAFGPAPAAY